MVAVQRLFSSSTESATAPSVITTIKTTCLLFLMLPLLTTNKRYLGIMLPTVSGVHILVPTEIPLTLA